MIVIGAGVIGCSVAWHLARLGAGRVLVLDRGRIAEGTSAMSSGILRTHYSVPANVELARLSWKVFERFAQKLDDDEASADGALDKYFDSFNSDGDKARARALSNTKANKKESANKKDSKKEKKK